MIGDVSLLVHPFFALFNLMEYKELSPDEKLLPFVKCFWQYNPGSVGQVHAILPNGCFELFFILVGDRLVTIRNPPCFSIFRKFRPLCSKKSCST